LGKMLTLTFFERMLDSPLGGDIIFKANERQMMFSIGQFSKITGLTIKTLRHYHTIGLLEPTRIDPSSGYRYCERNSLEKAQAIKLLRSFMLPLDTIRQILTDFDDEADILEYLESHRSDIDAHRQELEKATASLDEIIAREKDAREFLQAAPSFEVEIKTIEDFPIASIRWTGRYDEVGKILVRLMKHAGPLSSGRPFNLYYDEDYKEEGADIETCIRLRKQKILEGINTRILSGGRVLSLVHLGPYEHIGNAYARVAEYGRDNGHDLRPPSREIYLKGPGPIFRGNPKKYLTEIQYLLP